MSLLIVVVGLVIWIFISFFLARILTKWSVSRYKVPTIFILTIFIFILPAVDEIVGKYQFKSLCAENSKISVSENIEGRTVYLMKPPISNIEGYFLPITMHYLRFADKETNEIVFSYKVFYSDGGFLGRVLQLSDDNGPVLFYGKCTPPEALEFRKMINDFNVNLVD